MGVTRFFLRDTACARSGTMDRPKFWASLDFLHNHSPSANVFLSSQHMHFRINLHCGPYVPHLTPKHMFRLETIIECFPHE